MKLELRGITKRFGALTANDHIVQHFTGPGDAMGPGIGMVHQHFT